MLFRNATGCYLFAVALLFAGCVQIPDEPVSQNIECQELIDHVQFLCQPALAGRSPRSAGSRYARQYIAARYEAIGLKTWCDSKSYDQPFVIGTNVLGVLPGSDPQLADQFILVCAHYDHLGKIKGKIYPGASDNASGVAAMLEIAEMLALSEEQPRRSIVFAAFDAEETGLLGAFALRFHKDFDPEKLAGVVNIDSVGRKGFDVMDNMVIALGTERYPLLRQQIVSSGEVSNLDVLPIAREILGPRGDHAPFEIYRKPWVFFATGYYSDYHKPGDTPEKLDYTTMTRITPVIAKTIEYLANIDEVEAAALMTTGDREELASIQKIINAIAAEPGKAGLPENRIDDVKTLRKQIEQLQSNGEYRLRDRELFVCDLLEKMTPLMLAMEQPEQADSSQIPDKAGDYNALLAAYWHHPEYLDKVAGKLAKHLFDNPPGLFKSIPTYEDKQVFVDIRQGRHGDDSWWIGGENYELTLKFHYKNWWRPDLSFKMNGSGFYIVGSREDLVDVTLMSKLINEGTPVADNQTGSYLSFQELMVGLSGEDHGEDLDDWLQWRLKELNLDNQQQWVKHCFDLHDVLVRCIAIKLVMEQYRDQYRDAVMKLACDETQHINVRKVAIFSLGRKNKLEELRFLASHVDDAFKVEDEQSVWFDRNNPYYSHTVGFGTRVDYDSDQIKPYEVGILFHVRLMLISGEEFDRDSKRWLEWIDSLESQSGQPAVAR